MTIVHDMGLRVGAGIGWEGLRADTTLRFYCWREEEEERGVGVGARLCVFGLSLYFFVGVAY